MAAQGRQDLFGRQGRVATGNKFPPLITVVQAVSARRLCGTKTQKSTEELFGSICHDLRERLSSTVERGRPERGVALKEEQRPLGNFVRASSNVYDPPRQRRVRFHNPSLASSIAMLKNRHQQGTRIDSYALVDVLKRCSEQKNLSAAKQVHDLIIRSGMEGHRYVATTLMSVFLKCGRLQDAHDVFVGIEKANKTVITWNVMINAYAKSGFHMEAYQLFHQMKREGFIPDAFTYASILNPSSSGAALEWVKEVHGHARKAGLESNLRVGNALLHSYAKSGSVDDARLVFDTMEERDVITWSVMIGAYAESGCGVEAYGLFLQMIRERVTPNAVTYVSILNASASAGALEWVTDVHGHARKAGLESDLRVGNALVHMYAKSGSVDDARVVFDRMEKRDVITWNTMIGAYAESGCGVEAYELFVRMRLEDCIPDPITFLSLLSASASAGALKWVKVVHGHARKAGLESDLRVGNCLVHMYAKSGSIDDARVVFDRMEKRDVITWNTMIGAYAESGCGVEAYGLFLRMKREGFRPDAFTCASILNASSSSGALPWVKEVHAHARREGLELDLRVSNALVHMYAKCGSIDDSREIFERMEKRDVVSWNVMISGLAQHGCGHEALELFRKMDVGSVKPDETTFVAVLSACGHTRLVDDGWRVFVAMADVYGIDPTVEHCTCMVDLLGRAGLLQEAKLFIANMPVEPNAVTWGALLSACRTHGNVELGEFAAEECLKLEPGDACTYILLSNTYAAAGEWEKVSMMRAMIQDRGIWKEPGRSWIEVDNKIHDFVVGDTSHPEVKAIYSKLNELTKKLKAEGYIPDIQHVLQNVDEAEKELALCSHSEKLAIAYGLMRTPRGEAIRVFKNLRVCSDCHTATKFISKVTGREIIARDASRFHHFKDGVCSCGDYW